jgi:hypothetical protein
MARHADFVRLYELLGSWRVPWDAGLILADCNGRRRLSRVVLGSFTAVAASRRRTLSRRHFAAADFTRALTASAFMIMTAVTTTTTFVVLSSSAALRSGSG